MILPPSRIQVLQEIYLGFPTIPFFRPQLFAHRYACTSISLMHGRTFLRAQSQPLQPEEETASLDGYTEAEKQKKLFLPELGRTT